ncbi:hypothetical protein [Roseiconus lacunae]|uniref:hypothetical protein n=1 Tax=Roseiconus lacunae TaxID=2605694 RepID=UPI0011F2D17D|nr:hypothetical protein [Roseiconus lacunae]
MSKREIASPTWPNPRDPCGRIDQPISEEWLRQHEFRIVGNRRDDRMPVRRMEIGWKTIQRDASFGTCHSDLCIDLAPHKETWDQRLGVWRKWFCWIHQDEPYRSIHVRTIYFRWEIAKLFEGLTGRCWPGTITDQTGGPNEQTQNETAT